MTATEMGMPRGHASSVSTDGGLVTSSSLGIGGMTGRTPPTTPKKAGGKMLAVKILMLDDAYTLFQIQNKALGAVLLEQVCRQLNLLESDYFGLEYTDGNTRYWLDLDKPMNRQVCLSQVEPVLRFCVKFYTPDPAQLEEEYTRYLFALQIKRDLAHGELLCSENTAALMASYIVQAECGDYVEEDYPDHRYLSIFKFFPTQDDEIERRIMENHKKHIGMTPAAADLNLLETARRCEYYGIKMHPAKDHENVLLNLAAAHMGILVFQNYTKINTFSWAKIRKISFKRKRFLIKLHPEGYLPYGGRWPEGYYKDVVEFFFDGRNECKNFWKKCVEHHGFFRCSTVKKLPRQKTRVLSRGSSFRYSGRTQKQVQDFVRDNYIKRQPFQRSQSFRHSPSIHPNVGNVGMSISAQPLIPLRDNQCIGTPVSLSCGSMTLASGDTHSPGSPSHPETGFDHRDFETPSLTPSRQDTLSPETSITSSPHRGQDVNFTGQHLGSKLNRDSNHHFHRAPSLDTNSTASSRQHISSHTLHSILIETPIKDYTSYLDDNFVEPEDDSGDNLSHDSYELIEKELESLSHWEGSKGNSIAGSRNLLCSVDIAGSGEGLEWCESKGGVDMGFRESRPTSHTGSLPRSHGSNTSSKQTNGYTGSLPRAHSVSQSSNLSRSLAGSRASSRITLEIPIDARPLKSDDEELSSPGSPEFHENSVCEITSEKGYLLSTMQLGSITITDNSGGSVFSLLKSSRRSVLDDSLTDVPSSNLRSRSCSSSHSHLTRDSQETLKDPGDTSISVCTMSSRVSASVRAAKQVGQYVDYGSSQESLHKMSSCESDGGSSLSSHTRSSTTPRPIEFHSAKFLPTRRSTSTSPPSVTSGSSQLTGPTLPSRPHSMDFSAFNKKSILHVYGAGRGSDSGGNTDSDICSPLEIPLPLPPPERVQEVDEEEEDEEATPSQEHVQFFCAPPPDLGLITRIRGSSDEEEEEERLDYNKDEKPTYETETERESFEEDEDEELERPRHEEIVIPHALDPFSDDFLNFSQLSVDEQILVVIDDRQSPFSYDFECLPPPEVKEESPSSGEMDLSVTDTTSRERKIDESDASERTVIEKFRLPDDRLNKLGSKDSQMSIEEIDEGILDRRSSVGHDRRASSQSQEIGRKSPFVMERRQSYHDLEYFMPQSPRDRRPSSHDGDRRSPYLDAERRSSHSSVQDVGRRSPYEKERKHSSSSDRHSSVSSSRRGSSSSDRRGSNSSDRPSLSDIGRRTSISYEPGQRSPFFEAPVFEFDAAPEPFGSDNHSTIPPATYSDRNLSDSERKPAYFDGIVLEDMLLVDEYTEALIPHEEGFGSFSGAHVVEIVEGSPEEDVFEEETKPTIEIINVEQDDENLEVEILHYKTKVSSPKRNSTHPTKITIEPASFDDSQDDIKRILRDDNDKSPENVNADLSDDVFLTEKENSFNIDLSLDTSGLGPKDSVSSMVSPLPIEEKENELIKNEEMLGAIGGDSAEDEDMDHDDFYDDDDEDDHAQMSDHSSQSPDLGSEPDEYHDEYQEPEYFQHFNNRQIDVGFAFPSRTLSRISERSTTSEQEHEQDHLALHEVEPEHSDTSKASTPTEDKPTSLQSEEQQVQSDISTSASDETHETLVEEKELLTPTPSSSNTITKTKLNMEEKHNANQFAAQLFLRDLPDFVGEDSEDEFPSPPSSAFLENPHTELSQIETYYVEMNQRSNANIGCTEEGIYDNIPVKFEGIHEVSESESASEDNHTLHEQPPDDGTEFDLQNVEEIEKDEEPLALDHSISKIDASPSPPPPPPPRMLTRLASMARSPTPPLTPPTPITSIESPENLEPHVQYFSSAIHEEIQESESPSVSSSLSPQVENVDWVNI